MTEKRQKTETLLFAHLMFIYKIGCGSKNVSGAKFDFKFYRTILGPSCLQNKSWVRLV